MKRWSDPVSARREIEDLFAEEASNFQRDDGGLSFTLDDCLWQLRRLSRDDVAADEWANTVGVSTEFARSLVDYLTQFPADSQR